MAREPLKNVGASVCARLHHNRFVLKGAMLFVTWGAATFRPTRDLDVSEATDLSASAQYASF